LNYSISFDSEKSSRAIGMELGISPKHAHEVCRAIKGMQAKSAQRYLEDVIALKRAVPFRRYNRNVSHKRSIKGSGAGRYPEKAAKEILTVLKNAVANAEYKGLDPDGMKIVHAATKKGRVTKGWTPRAMGRATPKRRETVSIEMILSEGVSAWP
jgi:large subunit ribosomal protein L22